MIINLTQHKATTEQIAQGVVDVLDKQKVSELLTFDVLPSPSVLHGRALELIDLVHEWMEKNQENPSIQVMIGGAPYLMSYLERSLIAEGLTPVYAFSQRESVETNNPDGSVTKTQVFRHCGFVTVEEDYVFPK